MAQSLEIITPKAQRMNLSTGEVKFKIDVFNKRIKIIKFEGKVKELMEKLKPLIHRYEIGKVLFTAKERHVEKFKEQGFIMEAKIDSFRRGETAYFLSRFIDPKRKMCYHVPEEEEVLIKAREYLKDDYSNVISKEYQVRDADLGDAKELASLYDSVFTSYPTPMNDAEFIQTAMEDNMIFKVVTHNGKIISAASADMDPENLNAEMTDCATLPEYRGNKLMGKLIEELEAELQSRDYITLYTIARARSVGMNIVFAKQNYSYGGRLVNNCNIMGRFENMNIWHKQLRWDSETTIS